MSKQAVFVGTVANDGTGDPARTAFTKINSNFNELYPASGSVGTGGALVWTDSTGVAVTKPDGTVLAFPVLVDALPDGTGNAVATDLVAIEHDPAGTKASEKLTLQKACLVGLTAAEATTLTVAMASAVSGSTVGGGLAITAGAGNSAAGGAISITPGAGGGSSAGGALTLNGGAGGGVGGGITIATGAGSSANGGDLVITTGSASTSGKAGLITITGGTNASGGVSTTWTWVANKGAANASGSAWTIRAGPGGATSGSGGNMLIAGGLPTDGTGGNVNITAGTAATTTSTSRAGGNVTITCGNSTIGGLAGNYATVAGSGGTTGTGGDCSFISGTGGSVSGNAGNILFTAASTTSGNGGSITLQPGALGGGGTNGAITLKDSATTAIITVNNGQALLGAPTIGPNYTIGTLPTAIQFMRAFVTDALAPVFGNTVVAGGAVTVPVYYDGANWVVG